MWFIQCYITFAVIILLSSVPIDGYVQQFEKCKIEDFQRKFDVLPGRGWDNLLNEPMGEIIDLKFSLCKYSQDNIYLLPDFVSLTPTKTSKVNMQADYFSNFVKYSTVTSNSINIDADLEIPSFSISGSYSQESEQVRVDQIETKSSIFRVQLRYNIFKAMFEPNFELHPTFHSRILDIARHLQSDKESNYSAYLSDMIVRDYGTHVIQSVDAGAVLSKIDFLNSQYIEHSQSDKNKISVKAAASFFNVFKISVSSTDESSRDEINKYDQSCLKSRIQTFGGTLFGLNFTMDKWQQSVLNNMVPIDRTGNPIYYVITSKALPNLDDSVLHEIQIMLKKAVNRYYSANTRRGCLDINSPNFNPDANVDSKNCESPKVTFNFGGTYQTCSGPDDQCSEIQQMNPATGSYSCPNHFRSVLLQSGLNDCRRYCYFYWIFFTKCDQLCSYYDLYWCYPINVNETLSEYRFGGIISIQMPECPLDYVPLKVGLTKSMCVSVTNNDQSNIHAVKFGGFYSCSVGNPLAREYVLGKAMKLRSYSIRQLAAWPKSCAKGYIARVLSIDNGCEINYCTETNKISVGLLPVIIRPPFISYNFTSNYTTTGKRGGNHVILVSIFGTFLAISVLAGIILVVIINSYRKKLLKLQKDPCLLDSETQNYGTINNSDI